ncbi:MAG: hypothetical protein C0620_07040 [Desulfuromonas sp.]|nr:MAG: hypothetical protein C0620_07040 [Desulfuromonas sp.]
MKKILIAEDELLIANYIRDVLEAEGYEVVGIARDFQETVDLFTCHDPDLVCMDIRLKDETDGVHVAAHLRQLGTFALIYLTAHGDRENVQRAQQTEPFGFLVKPVTDQTILATVTTAMLNDPHVNHQYQEQVYRVTCDSQCCYLVDCDSGYLKSDQKQIRLTPKESQLLGYLLNQHGQIVSFKKIKSEIWRDCSVSDTSLKTLMWRLRSKLPQRDLIETIPGFGYRITTPAERISS